MAVILLLASSCFAQDVKRPTTELDAGAVVKCGAGTKQVSGLMPKAYDAIGQSTSSSIGAQGTMTTAFYSSRTFQAWQGASSSYSVLTLNVNSSATLLGLNVVRYSTDGGATWTDLISSSGNGWPRRTSTATLSTSQDLSQLEVAVCTFSNQGGNQLGPSEVLTVYDIWTAGTTTPQGAGVGSSSGSPHRGMVIVN